MRVRIYMTSGDRVDAEQYSTDDGATWADITVAAVKAAMGATTGYTVVRDLVSHEWRSFRNVHIESIGPAGDLLEVVPRLARERIEAVLAMDLPRAVRAVQNGEEPFPEPDTDSGGR